MDDECPGFRRATAKRQRLVADHLRELPCPFIPLLDIEVWQRGRGTRLPAAMQLASHPSTGRAKGFALELLHCSAHNMQELRFAVYQNLQALGSNAQQVAETDQWWFSSTGPAGPVQWFTTVHANFYPVQHARYWPLKWPAIMLIPAWIFRRTLPQGASAETRREVRHSFDQRGLRYAHAGGAVASDECADA